ncbi:MAG TPA: response regulator transcription factor [Mycobacteriales bacterium]|nr:response regulator transcription factor [Mycobacteriales bacterium]
MTTVLICDGRVPGHEDLRRRVTGIPGVDRVVTCETDEQLLTQYERCTPDLVLLDVGLPGGGGAETIRARLRQHPDAHVLLLTGQADQESATETVAAVTAGARGFLAKEGSPAGFRSAVVGALAGRHLSPVRDPAAATPVTMPPVRLTERELQVLRGMSQGRSNAEIGRSLYLSEDTVKTHARRLFRKLGVHDRAKAVAFGFRQGFVS